jgi:tRNA(Ile)-lysidine synthase
MPSVSARYAPANNRFEYPSGADDPERNAPVVLMVSGGADSTALLVLACTSKLDIQDGRGCARIARERLHVLHVNHQLRGIDAEEDEECVVGLAEQFGVPYTIRRVDVAALAAAEGGSSNTENVGREVRYRAAAEIANELYISESTVKFHIHNLLKKTDCSNRINLYAKYRHAGLL